MKQRLNLRDSIKIVSVGKGDHTAKNLGNDHLRIRGRWSMEHVRDGVVIDEQQFDNSIVDGGANHILGVEFDAVTQVTTWYVGLVDNGSFSAFNNADLMNAHAGWIESVAYSEPSRVIWTAGSPSGRSITNASAFIFTINSPCTLQGVFVTSDNTKTGTTGILLSTAAFTTPQPWVPGDLLRLVYTISC